MAVTGKILLLMRHATPENPLGVRDHDRPLSPQGHEEAARVAAFLAEKNIRPDLILVSSAQRTVETAAAFRALCPKIETRPDLYHATPQTLRGILHEIDPDVKCVMIVAHNPGIEAFSEIISGHDVIFDPATLTVISCTDNDWAKALGEKPRLSETVKPGGTPPIKGNSAGRYQP